LVKIFFKLISKLVITMNWFLNGSLTLTLVINQGFYLSKKLVSKFVPFVTKLDINLEIKFF